MKSTFHPPTHILITGASSGIGTALALFYAEAGRHLSIHGRNAQRLDALAPQIRARGATCEIGLCDVTDAAGMAGWITACDKGRPIDLAIANAGISAGSGGGVESAGQARAIFAVNLEGVLNTVQPLLPLMMARKTGQIALMSSLAGFVGMAGAPAYCASKAAVRIYGESLRATLSNRSVRINVICPGFIKTPMTDVNRFPMPFLMSPERAASLIARGLAKDQARIAFPWPMLLAVRLLAVLPASLFSLVNGRMPRKSG